VGWQLSSSKRTESEEGKEQWEDERSKGTFSKERDERLKRQKEVLTWTLMKLRALSSIMLRSIPKSK